MTKHWDQCNRAIRGKGQWDGLLCLQSIFQHGADAWRQVTIQRTFEDGGSASKRASRVAMHAGELLSMNLVFRARTLPFLNVNLHETSAEWPAVSLYDFARVACRRRRRQYVFLGAAA